MGQDYVQNINEFCANGITSFAIMAKK